jgi:NitT/TauT family transport system ATP-binding protein
MMRIEVVQLSHAFGSVAALMAIDVVIENGEFVAVVGPSGCGKSTLLSCIAGLIRPSGGYVRIGEEVVQGVRTEVGYVTQSDYLLPWRSVLDNVILPLELRGARRQDAVARATELLRRAGLEGFEKNLPAELSGGMRQRANLVRTLIYEPSVVLLDEPFGSLDAMTRVLMQDVLRELLSGRGATCVLVTHDIREAVRLGNRVIVLSGRPGRVLEIVEVVGGRDGRAARDYEDRIWTLLRDEVEGRLVGKREEVSG